MKFLSKEDLSKEDVEILREYAKNTVKNRIENRIKEPHNDNYNPMWIYFTIEDAFNCGFKNKYEYKILIRYFYHYLDPVMQEFKTPAKAGERRYVDNILHCGRMAYSIRIYPH